MPLRNHAGRAWGVAAATLLAVGLATACAAGPALTPAPAGPPPLVLEPSTSGTRLYNVRPTDVPPPGPYDDLIEGLVAEASRALRRGRLWRDPRLDAVCTDLARVLVDNRPTPFELVEFALQHAGIVEPAPRLILATVSPGDAARDAFAAHLRERLPDILRHGQYRRLGIGAVERDDHVRLIVALQESFIALRPFPRELPPEGDTVLEGRIDPQFSHPRVYITRPSGAVKILDLGDEKGGAIAAGFTCYENGRYQVEVTADNRFGATVLANFPIFCGFAPPTTLAAPQGEDVAVDNPRTAERRLFDLLNAERWRHHLPPLEWHPALAQLARAHSRDMFESGFVGHISPRFGDAAARVRRAHIKAGLVLENVARAVSAGEVQRGLMGSPAHRQNLLSAKVTHVGIGVHLGGEVAGRREIFVTEILMSLPREAAPGESFYKIE